MEYFPSGKIFREAVYADDLLDGEEKKYFENGKPQSFNHYRQGKLHGLSRTWNEAGVLTFEGEYKEALRHGKFNKFYDDGKPWLQQIFVDDQLDGIKKAFDKEGKVTKTKYDKGKKLS